MKQLYTSMNSYSLKAGAYLSPDWVVSQIRKNGGAQKLSDFLKW